ncbi:alcohol dehydrogenase [Arthrobacter sp. RIT-PI-e]|uniref:NADP-dependent oxidoreductase n=1 Tax=Arthrobacter sp. RIT-PI-e TaxID=1681197 RepID=UPI0006760B6A|nr:NADP-dependent oxidoreductase [Arthrobacter sp. RIT-PI-e]KNC17736.1 alcohol dehydrogenase [Arthrobacter sp. RIT-PI-e]
MKAIGVTEFGGPEALQVQDLPDPHPGAKEVRIKVRAAAVSPTDAGVRTGSYDMSQSTSPYLPGMDAAGVVDEVGDGSVWTVGDEVMAIALPLSEHKGAYTEYLVAPDDSIARIPAGSSLEQAATIPMNGLTAVQILELAALEPGQVLAVTGAAGTLGNYLVQLAKQQGLVVVADAASKDLELVRSLGPDHVVERGDGLADRIREIFPDGVDAVADTALLHEDAVPALRDGGVFIAVRGWKGEPARGIRFEAVWVFSEYHSHDKLDGLRRAVEGGVLTPRVADVLPAEDAPEAHRRMEAGGVRGRIVLTF